MAETKSFCCTTAVRIASVVGASLPSEVTRLTITSARMSPIAAIISQRNQRLRTVPPLSGNGAGESLGVPGDSRTGTTSGAADILDTDFCNTLLEQENPILISAESYRT